MEDRYRKVVDKLTGEFESHPKFAAIVRSGTPDWYSTLLSSLVLTVDDQEVELGWVNLDVKENLAHFLVFTKKLVIEAAVTARDISQDAADVLINAFPRRRIRSLSVQASAEHWDKEWPGVLDVRVEYREREDFIRLYGGGPEGSAIRQLVDSLRADLEAAG